MEISTRTLAIVSLGMGLFVAAASRPALAQGTDPKPPVAAQGTQPKPAQPTPTVPTTTVVVTAQKEPADPMKLPVSVTTATKDMIQDAGIVIVSDAAAAYAPNVTFTEFTVRKLSNARFRGIGSSPTNPSITTFVDGVPQLNTNSSSFDLLDVGQIEFVRGPQSALFGRNTLGGLINVTSNRPSLSKWTGMALLPFGNQGAWDLNGTVSGPVTEKAGLSFSFGHGERDGFTVNDITGNLLDSRSGTMGKGQFMWVPNPTWETRFIVSGERDRDGDYALGDLAAIRLNPFHVARNFEGHTDRNLLSTTILVRHDMAPFTISSTTGIVRWKTDDLTDLDYSPAPAITRSNLEEDSQFTQEVRLSTPAGKAFKLTFGPELTWQGGAFFFAQNYDQNAVNTFAPFALSPFVGVSVVNTSPLAALDDTGIGIFGQGTLSFGNKLDVSAGLRLDHENKTADITTSFAPAIAPSTLVNAEQGYTAASPQFAAAYHIQPDRTIYGTVSSGFKAGGFNPVAPAANTTYDEERSWNYEGGFKTSFLEGKATAQASVFVIDWNDLQLNVPLGGPAQFYVANVGSAKSSGFEVEASGKVHPDVTAFLSLGYTHARFSTGSVSKGVDVSGKKIPNSPDFTGTAGLQVTRPIGQLSVYGRGEFMMYGAFQYDEANTQQQGAYMVADFRVGARHKFAFAEFWMRNAFDARYIPVAFAYDPIAPSGFIGEMGKPRTFGIRAGVTF